MNELGGSRISVGGRSHKQWDSCGLGAGGALEITSVPDLQRTWRGRMQR